MMMTMKMTMNTFPMDIVRHILQYDGRMKFRNGIFMNQISKTDVRYEIIHSIPRKKICSIGIFVYFTNHHKSVFIVIPKQNEIIYSFIYDGDITKIPQVYQVYQVYLRK